MDDSLPLHGRAQPRGLFARAGLAHRARAAALHLAISITVIAAVFAAMIVFWYPWPIFVAAGAPYLLLVVSACDIVLGPALTFVVAAPGKRWSRLLFDLVVIGTLQFAALAYGVYTVHVARPVFNVFAVDRFELVSEADIRPGMLAEAPERFRTLSQSGPRRVGARPPDDPAERQALLMSAVSGGPDLAQTPRLYVDYESLKARALDRAQPIAKLREFNTPAEVADAIDGFGRPEEGLRYLPQRGAQRDLTAILDAASGDVLGIVRLHPWPR
jgi:hypothetical protein